MKQRPFSSFLSLFLFQTYRSKRSKAAFFSSKLCDRAKSNVYRPRRGEGTERARRTGPRPSHGRHPPSSRSLPPCSVFPLREEEAPPRGAGFGAQTAEFRKCKRINAISFAAIWRQTQPRFHREREREREANCFEWSALATRRDLFLFVYFSFSPFSRVLISRELQP